MTCTHPEHEKWHRTDADCKEAMDRLAAQARVRALSEPLFAIPTEGR